MQVQKGRKATGTVSRNQKKYICRSVMLTPGCVLSARSSYCLGQGVGKIMCGEKHKDSGSLKAELALQISVCGVELRFRGERREGNKGVSR